MKKNVLLLFSVVLLSSCGNKQQADNQEPTNNADSTTVIDSHNSQTSLDIVGTYKGTLSTATAGGMEVTINLTDSTYTKDLKYLAEKSSKPYNSKGSFSWDKDGSVITLNGEDKPNQYKVEEGALRALDIEGKIIEGKLADQYILKKQ